MCASHTQFIRRLSAAYDGISLTMIRPYTSSDKPTVLHIWRSASAIAHPFLSTEHTDQAEAMIRDQFLDLAETWMIEANGTAVGFIALLGTEVGGLFVLPAHQGKGLGRALLNHAAQSRAELSLCVFSANHAARGFYTAYGFEAEEERLNDFFGHPEIVMRRRC